MNELESGRLFFRNYRIDEIENFVGLFTNERIMTYVGNGVLTQEETENLWNKLIKDLYPQGSHTIWAIFAKENSNYIGHCAIRPRPTKNDDWEISYMLCEEDWGKGFATEIARRLIEYGFEQLDLPEIFATVDDKNLASHRVLEKAGMKLKEFDYDDNGRFSVYSKKVRTQKRQRSENNLK